MAAMIALKRAPVSKLLEKLRLSAVRSATAAGRSFSTEPRDLAKDTRTIVIDCRPDNSPVPRRRRSRGGDLLSSIFSDALYAFDPFSPTWSQIDQMLESSFAGKRGMWRGWDAREDENALYLRMEMPGLGKEDVRVTVEQNTLVIKGESREEEEGEDEENDRGRRRYSNRIDLPPNLYKLEEIRAEMKNGVLKVVVPKVKDGERKDVLQVQTE